MRRLQQTHYHELPPAFLLLAHVPTIPVLAPPRSLEQSVGFRTNVINWRLRSKLAHCDTLIDFTALSRWETICLTSVYNEESEFYFMPDMDRSFVDGPIYSTWTGKSQCKGNVPDTITLLLITKEGGALTSKFSLPADASRTPLVTIYELVHMPIGFRQCAGTKNAIARCAWIPVRGEHRCLLLFPRK